MKNSVFLLILILLFSSFTMKTCSEDNSEEQYQSLVSEDEVKLLNENLLLSDDFSDFLPENLQSHEKINSVVVDLLEDNYSLYQLTLEVLNTEENVKRNKQNYGLNSSPDLWQMEHKSLEDYIKKSKANFKKLYSDKLNDSLKSVFKLLDSFKKEYTSDYHTNLKEIRHHRNYRNSPYLEHEMLSKLGLYDVYRLLNKVQANKQYVQYQLFLNRIKHNNYKLLVENQKADLLDFMHSDKLVYHSQVKLFNPMSRLLTELKQNTQKLHEAFEKNEKSYNSKIVEGANKTLNLYIAVIENEIKDIHQ